MSTGEDIARAYLSAVRAELPEYDALQDAVAEATADLTVRRMLDLGSGAGETARRCLDLHPRATAFLIDPDPDLLEGARATLGDRAESRLAELWEPIPHGPFDLATSGLSLHRIPRRERTETLRRVRRSLRHGGRLVVGDVITPGIELAGRTYGDDAPDHLERLVERMRDVGFVARVTWSRSPAGLAVVVGQAL